jgi:hypothetical protein
MSMKDSLSQARFARYLASAGGNEASAMELYEWNTLMAQSLYVYLQCWEIAFRNKVDGFLRWKYGPGWPYDDRRAVRIFTRDEQRRLSEAKQRQSQQRKQAVVSTDAIVADLSAGFWVALLSSAYKVPYTWQYNLGRVFPNDRALTRETAHTLSVKILKLRNRIAHHEPIYELQLSSTYAELQRIVSAMCADSNQFARNNCTFPTIAQRRPAFLTHPF